MTNCMQWTSPCGSCTDSGVIAAASNGGVNPVTGNPVSAGASQIAAAQAQQCPDVMWFWIACLVVGGSLLVRPLGR